MCWCCDSILSLVHFIFLCFKLITIHYSNYTQNMVATDISFQFFYYLSLTKIEFPWPNKYIVSVIVAASSLHFQTKKKLLKSHWLEISLPVNHCMKSAALYSNFPWLFFKIMSIVPDSKWNSLIFPWSWRILFSLTISWPAVTLQKQSLYTSLGTQMSGRNLSRSP